MDWTRKKNKEREKIDVIISLVLGALLIFTAVMIIVGAIVAAAIAGLIIYFSLGYFASREEIEFSSYLAPFFGKDKISPAVRVAAWPVFLFLRA